ncbi:LasR-specific antiactivator QslA [Pseudomonas nicosulfuronedens]
MSSDDNTLDPASNRFHPLPGSDHPLRFETPPGWPEESHLVMSYGALVAREWLFAPGGETLWSNFARGRTLQRSMLDRMAYEIGFLAQLERRLERLS